MLRHCRRSPWLLAEVQGCTSCAEHVPLGPRPILQWHPRARILSAGQAPDRKGQESGKPFADGNGDRLGEWLGMTRELFYDAKQVAILPVGVSHPGSGDSVTETDRC